MRRFPVLILFLILTCSSFAQFKDVNDIRFRGNSSLMGMQIERVFAQDGAFLVETTGARYEYDRREMKIYQGLGGSKRLLASVSFDPNVKFEKIEGDQAHVLLWSDKFNIGIYGDSTCLIAAKQSCVVMLKNNLETAFHETSDQRAVFSDISGGFIVSPRLNGSGFSIKAQDKALEIKLNRTQVMIFKTFPGISEHVSLLRNDKSPNAVTEIKEGKRNIANAVWWGFDKNDSTFAIQSAIDSGASKVVIPYTGSDWVTNPIFLQSNQEIYLEPGVRIVAKKNSFKKTGDCLISAINKKNIKIHGYNSSLIMQKQDYTTTAYNKSEWRMGISLLSCENIKISGLTVKDTGGDGLYISESEIKKPCKKIVVEDCVFDNNYRQGISVISADDLIINNCILENTSGTNPSAGVDFEANRNTNVFSNIAVNNCVSRNNKGAGFVVSLGNMNSASHDISLLFDNCYSFNCRWGILIGSTNSSGPSGIVDFQDCVAESTQADGIRVEIDTRAFETKFKNCAVRNCAVPPESPVAVRIKRYNKNSGNPKQIILDGIHIYDKVNREAFKVRAWPYESSDVRLNIEGSVYVHNALGKKTDLGLDKQNINLKVTYLD